MKYLMRAAMASALAIAATTPATAAIVIGVGFNGGAVTQVATDGGVGSTNYNVTTGGYFFNTSATGAPILQQINLLTQSVNIQQVGGTGGVLNLYITQTDLSRFNGVVTSSFTSNTVTNASAVLTTYVSAANALFGGTQLQSASFGGTGMAMGSNLVNLTAPFSTTVRYDITFGTGGGNFNGTANLASAAVPEPATWATMLLGLGGCGYTLRRRKAVGTRIRYA